MQSKAKTPIQKPKVYLKLSDLGELAEGERLIAEKLLEQVGAEHFLRSESELLKRISSNLEMVNFCKEKIKVEQIDAGPWVAKLVSLEAISCRLLREARMTICTRPKESEELEEEPTYPNNEDLFLNMDA